MLVVDQLSRATKNTLRAFTINLKKWNWAEAEGFTDKDLIGTLSDQVFKEIKLSEIVQKLYDTYSIDIADTVYHTAHTVDTIY